MGKTNVFKLKHNPEVHQLVLFSNIRWDAPKGAGLPSAVQMGVDKSWDNEEISLYGADALSDRFDFCVNGFDFEVLEK